MMVYNWRNVSGGAKMYVEDENYHSTDCHGRRKYAEPKCL